jgi:VWFA-related protein
MGRTGGVSRRTILAALPFVSALRQLRAQNTGLPGRTATFSAGVKVVNLFATVRDKQGAVVRGLTKGDFLLQEDKRPQLIRYFSQESDLPLTLGLLVDVSGSQRRLIPEERTASFQFFDQVLREDLDRAFVIHFQGWVELLQNLTPSRDDLERSLRALADDENQYAYSGGSGRFPGGGGRGSMGGRGTALYDAVFLASEDLMRKQEGRKAIVILTDGVDTASMLTLEAAVEAAQRSDTLVYSVLFEDPDAYGGGFGRFGGFPPDGRLPLDVISHQTGGRLLDVNKKRTLEQVYESIEEELRSLYSIGYTPDRESKTAAGYHRVHLAAKEKGLVVQTRDGYYDS